MGRIGSRVCGLLLALGLFAFPVTARASDGFLGGLQDLTNTREIEQQESYEESYQEEYEPDVTPRLRSGDNEVEEVGEVTISEGIAQVTSRATSVPYSTGDLTMIAFLRTFFGGNATGLGTSQKNLMLLFALGIVFMWWGVRKSIKMLMSSFRKGKATL